MKTRSMTLKDENEKQDRIERHRILILKKERCSTKPCYKPCIKRGMIGRSWYKQHGYNQPCNCLYVELVKKINLL